MTYKFSPGWVHNPEAVDAAEQRMKNEGLAFTAATLESFRGSWADSVSRGLTSFLACTVEPDNPRAYLQQTGVCTSMLYRALQDCYNWDRVKFGGISRAVQLCFETLFAGSRITIGRGGLGYEDGSYGGWIAELVARFGVVERGIYQGVDLSRPREDLAQAWGRPGVGVPGKILELGYAHRFRAHRCHSVEELFDGFANGWFGGICRSRYAHSIDRDGFAVFSENGGHHTCLRGGFIDRRTNRRIAVEQQTHGSGVPDPHPVAHTTDGDVELSDGAYLVREDDLSRFIPDGEVWIYQPVQGEEFR